MVPLATGSSSNRSNSSLTGSPAHGRHVAAWLLDFEELILCSCYGIESTSRSPRAQRKASNGKTRKMVLRARMPDLE